ncbi:hypothetical protein V7S43_015962 [Phytophthora oleae]|uniref:Uncharacterized protein n=1 Tax=Phytophthora oleae TaxID=2107226 RepID=A0ABD3EX99_9STRA
MHPNGDCSTPSIPDTIPPKVAALPSKLPSGNIWTGSDSDFALSPGDHEEKHPIPEQRPIKRIKSGKQLKHGTAGLSANRKKNVKAVASTITIAPPGSPPRSPVSDLGVPLSVRHARKRGTTDEVWDLIHHLDEPYRKRNPWQPSVKVYVKL